jgi:Fe-S-cluster containining protein
MEEKNNNEKTELESSSSTKMEYQDSKIYLDITDKEKKTLSNEKSTFERGIVEAFKQNNSIDTIKKLNISYDEIKFYVKEVINSKGTKFILNRNILDKLGRIIERKYFNVNLFISKIFVNLLESSNYDLLSNNINLLIAFSNLTINVLDIISSTSNSINLEKKISSFLNYLLNNNSFQLQEEQKETIENLINNFPTRNNSEIYKNFKDKKDIIISYCQSITVDDKIEGIYQLMEAFGDTYSLEEQFDLLFDYCPQIFKALINKPNPENRKAYFQLGNFISSMFYSHKFKIKIDNSIKITSHSKSLFLLDLCSNELNDKNKIKLFKSKSNYSMMDLYFLNGTSFELTNQKDLLFKSENLFSICYLVINALCIYESIFDLQYVCYLLLKKIYLVFPQFRDNIEDLIVYVLINICSFTSNEERKNTIECRQFLHYLLKEGNEQLKLKLNNKINSKGKTINIQLEEKVSFEKEIIEFDYLNFSDFNLRVGYPNYIYIDAGNEYSKYLEIDNKFSLIYLGFATQYYDISFHLLKYCPNIINDNINYDENDLTDNGRFVEVFKLDKSECNDLPVKIILFVKEPGIYKILFDNGYSWINGKIIRYRISILKPLSEINIDNVFMEKEDNNINILNFGI